MQRLQALRANAQRGARVLGQVRLEVAAGVASGRIVAELDDVSMRFGERVVVEHFSATVLRGDKVGPLGPNGAGKTTLLQAHPRRPAADRRHGAPGTRLTVAYFDQLRGALDLTRDARRGDQPGSGVGRDRRRAAPQ